MDWMKLKDLQAEADRIGRPICAWTPKNPKELEPPNSPMREYVIDKKGKPDNGNYPKMGMKETEHSFLWVFQPIFEDKYSKFKTVGGKRIEILELVRWDDRRKNPDKLKFRTMTLEEAKKLSYGEHIFFIGIDGKTRRIKINGQPQVWVRSPDRVRIPVKYGLYEYSYFTEHDLHRMLVELE
jgi:hypothetical protein